MFRIYIFNSSSGPWIANYNINCRSQIYIIFKKIETKDEEEELGWFFFFNFVKLKWCRRAKGFPVGTHIFMIFLPSKISKPLNIKLCKHSTNTPILFLSTSNKNRFDNSRILEDIKYGNLGCEHLALFYGILCKLAWKSD